MKKETVVKITKWLMDFMFFAGFAVTLSLPFSIKWLGKYVEAFQKSYEEIVVIYFILGHALNKSPYILS